MSHLAEHARESMHANVGHMTHGLRDNATDLAEIWLRNPGRRSEFGEREIEDIQDTALKLNLLLSALIEAA